MKERILITGGAGLLGLNWGQAVRGDFSVNLLLHNRQIHLSGTTTCRFKLSSIDNLLNEFEKLKPRIVIHTAGLTNVEQCESNPDLAYHINVELAENLAKVCSRLNIKLVHISTDHLFSGNEKNLDEEHPISPLNVYAKTKAEAELRVLSSLPESLIIRTNFYGCGTTYRSSFSDMIINSLKNNQHLTLFQDVFYTPIYTSVLVQAVHDLLRFNASGIYNVVGDERLSKYDFGLKMVKHFGFDESLIVKGNFIDRSNLIRRPSDMSLSNEKICNFLKRKLGNVDEHLNMLYQHYETGNAQEIQAL